PTGDTLAERMNGPLQERFEEIRSKFHKLLDQQAAIAIRLVDVEAFEQLTDRVDDWLASPNESPGEQLWSEVESVVALLRGINQRESLRSHDKGVLSELGPKLEAPLNRDSWQVIDSLFGLDSLVDHLLERGFDALSETDDQRLRGRLRELSERV
ncbi:MAG: hypothetical protein AAF658_12005, partial [Myxococcota bacterium]